MMVVHFSHHHPLAAADKVAIFALCSICGDLATRPAAAPIYGCGDSACWFHLHHHCSELPQKLHHPFHHQHPLSLLPLQNKEEFRCHACGKIPRGKFAFRCDLCEFGLDVCCASLMPEKVDGGGDGELSYQRLKFVGHEHELLVCYKDIESFEVSCSACELSFQEEILSHGEELLVVGQLMGDESSSKVVREAMNKLSMEEEENQKNQAKDFSSLADLDAEIVSLKAQVVELQAKIDALTSKRARFIFR